jgi:hypothetical protein
MQHETSVIIPEVIKYVTQGYCLVISISCYSLILPIHPAKKTPMAIQRKYKACCRANQKKGICQTQTNNPVETKAKTGRDQTK